MEEKKLKFKVPGLYKGLSEEAAIGELERIRNEHGTLTAEIIVEESRNEKAVLHGIFEWNDTLAAENYRKSQAQALLRNIDYEIVTTEITTRGRFYVNTYTEETPDKRTYIPIDDAIKDKVAYKDLLEQAKRDAIEYVKKYAVISELGGIKVALQKFAAGFKVDEL